MRKLLFALPLLIGLLGCISSEVDPRCRIEAPDPYRGRVAQHVNGSKLWRAYFETLAPSSSGPTEPWIDFRLVFDREILNRVEILEYEEGDYEAGTVNVEFSIVNPQRGTTLHEQEEALSLPEFAFVEGSATTREQIQKAVFQQTEERIFPYLDRWVNLAALRAISEERGASGEAFVPILEEQVKDPWAEELSEEARLALKAIRGEVAGGN
jgi:hypothetical protein